MTIQQAIDRADAVCTSGIAQETKRTWLTVLDGLLRREVIALHETDGAFDGVGADLDSADTATLLAEEPYSEIYIHWLTAQTCLALGEAARYANSMTLYNSAWFGFSAAVKRKYPPKKRGQRSC